MSDDWTQDNCQPQTTDLLIAHPRDLKPGDVVVNWKGQPRAASRSSLVTRVKVRSAGGYKVSIQKFDKATNLVEEVHLIDMSKWGGPYRIRSRTGVTPGGSTVQHTGPRKITSAPAKAKAIPEFPHTCTRCGAAAYVGMFEISHKDEAAANACVARRK